MNSESSSDPSYYPYWNLFIPVFLVTIASRSGAVTELIEHNHIRLIEQSLLGLIVYMPKVPIALTAYSSLDVVNIYLVLSTDNLVTAELCSASWEMCPGVWDLTHTDVIRKVLGRLVCSKGSKKGTVSLILWVYSHNPHPKVISIIFCLGSITRLMFSSCVGTEIVHVVIMVSITVETGSSAHLLLMRVGEAVYESPNVPNFSVTISVIKYMLIISSPLFLLSLLLC